MSEEDLERYESEIELGLVQEYRAVLPVFAYVIETERRFYLANEVSLNVRVRHDAGVHRARAARRLGVGHVPPGPLRARGAGRHVPRREHRAAARTGALSEPFRGGGGDRSSGVSNRRDARPHGRGARPPRGTGPTATRSSTRNWRCAAGEIDLLCAGDGAAPLVVCEVKARSRTRHGHPLEAVTPAKQRRLRRLAAAYLRSQDRRYDRDPLRRGRGARARTLHVVEGAF